MTASAESTPRERVLAGAGLLVTSLCWGSMVPATASLLTAIDPLFLAASRYLIAVPALAGHRFLRGMPASHLAFLAEVTTVVTVQPGFGIGLLPTTPSGIWMRSAVVGEPAQPCGTISTAL